MNDWIVRVVFMDGSNLEFHDVNKEDVVLENIGNVSVLVIKLKNGSITNIPNLGNVKYVETYKKIN